MATRTFHDGESDGLEALEALDPETIESFSDLLAAMKKTAFGGRRLGDAFEILKKMVEDPDCTVILTLSGAMTIAKMGKIICSMIDRNMVQAVVSTGALIAHGLSEAVGKTHYKYHPSMTDTELYEKGYNRVYDTLEMETNLNHVERVVSQTLKRMTPETPISSEILTREIGKTLHDDYEGPGILKSAYEQGVSVYIPAFTDSEMGLDVSIWAMKEKRQSQGQPPSPDLSDQETWQFLQQSRPAFNPFLDLNSYTEKLLSAKRLGIFTIGGGVPRNWAQQTPPYIEILNLRMDTQLTPPRYQYGVRICPEPDYWGGLSGCTYEEGVSWGKFVPRKEGGMFAEVLSDATVVWPLLMMGLLESARRR
ncbi:MAG: deoxyhypusine synthase-like protein [Nitrospirales bacterium]|nr:MAG: deoxyhypusine synthase-like protein [Nitrospirales bacterium]